MLNNYYINEIVNDYNHTPKTISKRFGNIIEAIDYYNLRVKSISEKDMIKKQITDTHIIFYSLKEKRELFISVEQYLIWEPNENNTNNSN